MKKYILLFICYALVSGCSSPTVHISKDYGEHNVDYNNLDCGWADVPGCDLPDNL